CKAKLCHAGCRLHQQKERNAKGPARWFVPLSVSVTEPALSRRRSIMSTVRKVVCEGRSLCYSAAPCDFWRLIKLATNCSKKFGRRRATCTWCRGAGLSALAGATK